MEKSRNTKVREELKKSLDKHPRTTKIIFAVLVLLLIVLLVWGIVSLVLLAFPVDSIRIEGESPYSEGEILAACKLERGDRLYYLSAAKKERALLKAFPYIKNVDIKSYFPNKVVISIECYDRVYVARSEGGYVYMNESFTVLQSVGEYSNDGGILLSISQKVGAKDGETAEFSEKEELERVYSALKSSGLEKKTTHAFMKDKYNIAVVLENSCIIELGNSQNLEKKLSLFSEIYESESMSSDKLAKINVSDYKSGVFRPLDETNFAKEIDFYEQ